MAFLDQSAASRWAEIASERFRLLRSLPRRRRTTGQRAIKAFVLSPIAGLLFVVPAHTLIFGSIGLLHDFRSPSDAGEFGGSIVLLVVGWLVLGLPTAYQGVLLVLLPAWLVLRRIGRESGAAFMLIGAIGGPALMLIPPDTDITLMLGVALMVGVVGLDFAALAGASVAAAFWMIARQPPDLEHF